MCLFAILVQEREYKFTLLQTKMMVDSILSLITILGGLYK